MEWVFPLKVIGEEGERSIQSLKDVSDGEVATPLFEVRLIMVFPLTSSLTSLNICRHL